MSSGLEQSDTISQSTGGYTAGGVGRFPINFVIQGLGPGGAEKQLLLTARYLAEAGYPCRIFTLGTWQSHPRILKLCRNARESGVEFYPAARRRFGAHILELWRLVRKSGPGVLWSWGRRSDLLCKGLSKICKDSVLFCSLRSAHEERARKFQRIDRFLSETVIRYVSNSWLSCELLERSLPDVMSRCRVIYNCLEAHELEQQQVQLPSNPRPLRVMMLGNIAPVKAYDHVLELAKLIRDESLPIVITIAGRDYHQNWLQNQIKKLGLESIVEYFGEASEPYGYLRRGHVFLLMSRLEGTPNALLEAMNIGLPCVSTKVGDVPRITEDGLNIRLVNVGDVGGILAILKDFLVNWESAVRLGCAARELCAKQFTHERMVADTIRMLDEIRTEIPALRFRAGLR